MHDRTLRTCIIALCAAAVLGVAPAWAGARNQIGAVAIDSDRDVTTIRVRGSETPTFTVYKLERPTRVVVDLAGAALTAPVGGDDAAVTYSVGGWAVGQVQAMALEDGSATVRVVATLARPGRYDVKADGADVVIKIVARDPAPATASAADLAAAQRETAAAKREAEAAKATAAKAQAAAEAAQATARTEAQRAVKAQAAAEAAALVAATAGQTDRSKAARELAAAQAEAARAKAAAATAATLATRAQDQARATQAAADAELARARQLSATAAKDADRIRASAQGDAARTRAEADAQVAAAKQQIERERAAVTAARTEADAQVAAAKQHIERERAAASAAKAEAERLLAAARAEQARVDAAARTASEREAAARSAQAAAEARQTAAVDAATTAQRERAAAEAAIRAAAEQKSSATGATGDAQKARAQADAAMKAAQARLATADQARAAAAAAQRDADAAVTAARRESASARAAVDGALAARATAEAATAKAVKDRAAAEQRATEMIAAADRADARRRAAEQAAASATAAAQDAVAVRTTAQADAARAAAEADAARARAARTIADARAAREADERAARAAQDAAARTVADAEAKRAADEAAAAAARDAAARTVAEARATRAAEEAAAAAAARAATAARADADRAVADARARREAEERALAESRAAREAEERATAAAATARVEAEKQRAAAERALAELKQSQAAQDRAAAAAAAQGQAAAAARAAAAAQAKTATAAERARAEAEVRRLAAAAAAAEAALAARKDDVAARQQEVAALDAARTATAADLARQQAAADAARAAREREEARLVAAKQAREAEEATLAKLRAEAAKVRATPAAAPAPVAPARSRITAVSFAPDADDHVVTIALDGAGATAELVRADGKRAELVVRGATLPANLTRTLDASRFGGPIRTVSSYTDRATGEVRVVVALARDAAPRLDTTAGKLQLRFAAAGPQISSQRVPSPVVGGFGATSVPVTQTSVAQLGKRRSFRGPTIDLDFKDADIHDLLRALARVGNVSMIVPDEIRASVTVQLKRVPWEQALEVILASKGLWYRKDGTLYRIGDRKVLDAEDEADAARRKALVEMEAPRPDVFTLNYANAEDLATKLAPLLSPKGKIEVDPRTNSLIVNDVKANRNDVIDLARRLDTQTPQITIEARVVEARSNFKREFGIQWGGRANASAAGGNATGLVFPSSLGFLGGADDTTNKPGTGLATPTDFAVNLPVTSNGALGMTLGSVGGNVNINLRLTAMEDTGTARIISAPKVTVLNNVEAVMKQGVRIPISQVSAQGTQTVFVEANLELKVTPYVSQRDCAVVMDVSVIKAEPNFARLGARGDPTIENREASSRILVNDGETTVMGGIYTRNTSLTYSKIPVLGDLPVLGWLFKSRKEADDRAELLIFITPKITNKALLRCQP